MSVICEHTWPDVCIDCAPGMLVAVVNGLREERDAARARIAELEAQLDEARNECRYHSGHYCYVIGQRLRKLEAVADAARPVVANSPWRGSLTDAIAALDGVTGKSS